MTLARVPKPTSKDRGPKAHYLRENDADRKRWVWLDHCKLREGSIDIELLLHIEGQTLDPEGFDIGVIRPKEVGALDTVVSDWIDRRLSEAVSPAIKVWRDLLAKHVTEPGWYTFEGVAKLLGMSKSTHTKKQVTIAIEAEAWIGSLHFSINEKGRIVVKPRSSPNS